MPIILRSEINDRKIRGFRSNLFFDGISVGPRIIVSRIDTFGLRSFWRLLRGQSSRKSVRSYFIARPILRVTRALHARRVLTQPAVGVVCWNSSRATKATADEAAGQWTPIPHALLPSGDGTDCWRAEMRMFHADLRRAAAAVIAAKVASALL